MHHSGPRDKDVKGRSRIEKRKRVEPHGRPITLAVFVVTRCLYKCLVSCRWWVLRLSFGENKTMLLIGAMLSLRCRDISPNVGSNHVAVYRVDFLWVTTFRSTVSNTNMFILCIWRYIPTLPTDGHLYIKFIISVANDVNCMRAPWVSPHKTTDTRERMISRSLGL